MACASKSRRVQGPLSSYPANPVRIAMQSPGCRPYQQPTPRLPSRLSSHEHPRGIRHSFMLTLRVSLPPLNRTANTNMSSSSVRFTTVRPWTPCAYSFSTDSEHGPLPAIFLGLSSLTLKMTSGRPLGHSSSASSPSYPMISVQSGPGPLTGA